MTHPRGSINFIPNAGWSLPRSYVKTLRLYTNSDNIPTYAAGLITLPSVNYPNVTQFIKLRDNFIPWTSNGWTLDYMFEWWYYTVTPGGTEFPYGGTVWVDYNTTRQQTVLNIQTDVPNTNTFFALAAAPSGYWCPPELGD